MAGKEVKVLLVDDDERLLEKMQLIVKLFGLSCTTAVNARQAWDLVLNNEFNLVISDIEMPGTDGFELMKEIKSHNLYSPRVILMSQDPDLSVAEVYNQGADGFFTKPFDASAVREASQKSMLREEQRWINFPSGPTHFEFDYSCQSLEQAEKKGDLHFGRGGFFWRTNEAPLIGDRCKFKVSVLDGLPCPVISGTAQIKWCRNETSDGPAGFGAEIEYVDKPALNVFAQYLRNSGSLSFIPIQ